MKTKDLTLGGILTALTLIVLYLAAVIQTNSLTFLTIASFMVPVGLMRGNLKTASLIFISSSLLSFFIVPLNIALMYSLFFGIYGIIKYFAEKTEHIILEYFLKFIFFNGLFFVLFMLMQSLLKLNMFDNLNVILAKYLPSGLKNAGAAVIWLVMQLAFFIFDYALTLLIDYYKKWASRF